MLRLFHTRFNSFSVFSVLNKAVIKRPFHIDNVYIYHIILYEILTEIKGSNIVMVV